MDFLRITFFFLCLVPGVSAGLGAGSLTNLARWDVGHWTTEDGLPQNTVTALAQSKDGYLWIGTRDGLARFDGVGFVPWVNELHLTQPGDADVLQLCADEQEGVWIRTKSGLFLHRRGEFQRYPLGAGELPGQLHFSLAAKGTGVWLAALDALLLFQNGKVTQRYTTNNGLPREGVEGLMRDADNQLWIRRGTRLWRMDEGKFVPLATIFGTNISPQGAFFDGRKRAWFGTWERLDVWQDGRCQSYTTEHGLPANRWVNHVTVDSSGQCWVKPEHGLLLLNGNRFESISGTEIVPETDIRQLMEDREGGLWVGTGRGGVYRLKKKKIRLLNKEDGLTSPNVNSFSEGGGGRLWIGTAAGLNLVQENQVRQFRTTLPEAGNNFSVVLEDRRGRVWASLQDHGLFQLKGDQVVPEPLPATNSARMKVTVLHEDRAGRLWVGAREGLFCRRENGVRAFTRADGLGDEIIRGIVEAADGTLWIGTARAGLYRIRGDVVERCDDDGKLLSHDTRPLHVEKDGTLWFSTPVALYRWKKGKIDGVTRGQGLFEHDAMAMLDDGLGNFWMNCNRGIYRVTAQDLHAVAEGRGKTLPCSVYGTMDGLSHAEGNGDAQPCAARLADGRLGFATTRGLAFFSPGELLQHETPPPVQIEQVNADGVTVWGEDSAKAWAGQSAAGRVEPARPSGTTRSGGAAAPALPEVEPAEAAGATRSLNFPTTLELGPDQGRVIEVLYTAIALSAWEKVRFQWMLEPRDNAWRDAKTHRSVFLHNLRPGRYTFRVRACNPHGLWNETGASLGFVIEPNFFETWRFYTLCAASLVLAGLGVHHWRVSFLRRIERLDRAQAVQLERTRIAQDLHDDLGANLTGIAFKADLAQRQSGDAEATASQLKAIAASTRALVDEMRATVWALNPRHDTMESLASFLAREAQKQTEATGLRCRLEIQEELPDWRVLAPVRHHLYLAVKEALNNAVKHARASEIKLALEVSKEELRVRITDDGRGLPEELAAWYGMQRSGKPHDAPSPARFPQAKAPPGHLSPAGNGLSNMRARLESMGGTFTVKNITTGGTQITFMLPHKSLRKE